MKTTILTAFALIAFAANSVFCRLALSEPAIDAASFTAIRLLTGIAVLLLIYVTTQSKSIYAIEGNGSWWASIMLFVYAVGFSYAYVTLDTGTGALILFAAVQITMIVASLVTGHKLVPAEWVGIAAAFGGFIYLMLPGVSAPPLMGLVLMAAAGVAWGFYTLAGKGARNPLADTTFNFVRTLPMVIVLVLLTIVYSKLSFLGVILAMLSGGLASGIGYTIWYMALNGLTAVQASVLQLLVPVIAALGGIVFAGEVLSLRLMISSALILGGILCVIFGRYYHQNSQQLK